MKKIFVVLIAMFLASNSWAKTAKKMEPIGFGLNLAAGAEIGTGLAGGGGMTYIVSNEDNTGFEICGGVYFSAGSQKSRDPDTGFNYTDDIISLYYTIGANMLFNYTQGKPGIYQFVGFGAGANTRNVTRKSEDDPAANDNTSGSTGAMMINLGVAGAFANGFELRLQLPVFFRMVEGGSPVLSPVIIAGIGIRV